MLWLIPLLPFLLAPPLYVWWRHAQRKAMAASAGMLMLAVTGLVAVAIGLEWSGTLPWSDALVLKLGLTPMSATFALAVPLVAAPILVYTAAQEDRAGLARLMALMVAFVGVMELLVLAKDLLTLLIAWEIVGAFSWALIGQRYGVGEKTRHATQAFMTTRFGDLGLYLAAFIAFTQTGSLDYASLAQLEGPAASLFTAGVLLAAATKSAQLPFSPWLFSAMSGPAPVSALLHSATMVAAGVILLVQLHPMLSALSWFGPVTLAIGLLTALAGGLVATTSPHGKRLLAGSTSAHYGLMLVAVGAGYPGVATLHFVAHALMKGPLFLIVGMAGDKAGSYQLRTMGESGLPRPLKWAALGATLALAGLFPLGAGWTKEAIISAAGHFATWAAVVTAVAGGLSALYASRFLYSLFPRVSAGPGQLAEAGSDTQRLQRGAIHALVLATLALTVAWLPGASGALSGWLQAAVPAFKAWEIILSMGLVIAGILAGCWLARRGHLAGGGNAAASFISNWFGLGAVARWGVVVPVGWLAQALARADDRIIDAGIGAVARLTLWTSAAGDRASEWVFDELPEGLARLSGVAGRQMRQLQSGMLHHYYFILTAGVMVIVITLAAGTLMGDTL